MIGYVLRRRSCATPKIPLNQYVKANIGKCLEVVTRHFVSTRDDDDNTSDEDVNDNDLIENAPFPRLGWSPGSFGARALRKSRARKPGEPTGRTKPKKTEEDYWLEAYEAYGVPSRAAKGAKKSQEDDDVDL